MPLGLSGTVSGTVSGTAEDPDGTPKRNGDVPNVSRVLELMSTTIWKHKNIVLDPNNGK